MEVDHIVNFSGGVGSYLSAKRVAQRYGTKNLTLLFADTHMEDEDLYRFVDEAAEQIKPNKFERISDGRTPWEVFQDERFLGNSRVDPCSKILKRKLLDRWVKKNCDPGNTIIYIGIDWSEIHRWERLILRKVPYLVDAPLCHPPLLSRREMQEEVIADGIALPRLYLMGFPHNNCGGFCIKAGQAQFALLLQRMPERYRMHEEEEQKMRVLLNSPVTILRYQKDGIKIALSLKEFRERIENNPQSDLFDKFDWGGCGCALD